MNKASVKLARKLAKEYSTPDKPRFIAGSIGPTNKSASISPDVMNPDFRDITFDELVECYKEQTDTLAEEGVDVFLIETIFDTLNAKAAIFAIKKTLKEQNNNELLKELEIKDLHIKSLEKLLMQSNPMEIIDKNKNDNFNMTFSHNFDKKENNVNEIQNINDNINNKLITSTSTFQKDDEREKELNKLMNNMKSKDNLYDKEMNEELRQLAKETNKFNGNNSYICKTLNAKSTAPLLK